VFVRRWQLVVLRRHSGSMNIDSCIMAYAGGCKPGATVDRICYVFCKEALVQRVHMPLPPCNVRQCPHRHLACTSRVRAHARHAHTSHSLTGHVPNVLLAAPVEMRMLSAPPGWSLRKGVASYTYRQQQHRHQASSQHPCWPAVVTPDCTVPGLSFRSELAGHQPDFVSYSLPSSKPSK
jgi:hypothetical protein